MFNLKNWLRKNWAKLHHVKSHKTTVTKQSGMQKLICRLDGYVCRGQQGEIERMHPTPSKRIPMEISVGVGLQTWCAVALKRFAAFTKSGNVQEKYIYRLRNVEQLEKDFKSRCKPHLIKYMKSDVFYYEWYARATNAIRYFVHFNWQLW